MVIPSSRSKYREFHISQKTIFFTLTFISLFLITCTVLLINNINLQKKYTASKIDQNTLNSYREKAEKIDSLIANVNSMQNKVNKLTNLNNKLQTMVGVGGSDLSVGGSTKINDFEDAYFLNKSNLLTNLESEIDDILDEASKQSEVSESLDLFFKDHTSLLSHLPSLRPVKGGWISSYYGRRLDPFTKQPSYHYGLDISARTGTEIYAPADGIVTFAAWHGTYGKMLKIDHGNGFKTYFGHAKGFNVKVGQKVKRGDIIAFLGKTGRTTGPHLHYEIRLNNKPINPIKYIIEE